ncbi:hypothetical protein [Streptomyces nojiriensis]|uniref:hypothetical protein n=1 Tax=Streptomyces nojiriensis TaxID=66374 RepID=UPI003666FF2F
MQVIDPTPSNELVLFQMRAKRRRRVRGSGEARADGWTRTEADERLLTLTTGCGTLTLHQAATACWAGNSRPRACGYG